MILLGTLAGVVLAAAIIAAVSIPAALINGWALRIMWGWFVVPYFGVQPLTYLQAVGLVWTFHLIQRGSGSYKDHQLDWSAVLPQILLGPPITVGLAYVLRWAML